MVLLPRRRIERAWHQILADSLITRIRSVFWVSSPDIS